MIRKLNSNGKRVNFSSLSFIGGGDDRFVQRSREIFNALSHPKTRNQELLQRWYRSWKRILEGLYLPEEILYRARYLASEAIKQMNNGQQHEAAYDFRRAALLVLNHYVD